MPSLDRFLTAVRAIPPATRHYRLMSTLEKMLSDHLVYVRQLLGSGVFHNAMSAVKKEIAGPLATRRELVRRYGVDEGFYSTLKQADKVVKLVEG